MIAFADILAPDAIALDAPEAPDAELAAAAVALLRRAPSVLDWNGLQRAIEERGPQEFDGEDLRCTLLHARTESVKDLVMAVVRVRRGPEQRPAAPGVAAAVPAAAARMVAVFGIPVALAPDYLRLVGLLARAVRDPMWAGELAGAEDAARFLAVLGALERKI